MILRHVVSHNGQQCCSNAVRILCCILVFWGVGLVNEFSAEAESINIYIDADRTGARESGLSIEQGIRTALREVNNHLEGRDVELIILDHRGNSKRSTLHLQKYLKDTAALVVFSGLHSPPLLTNLELINTNNILVLDPWAAAGPITRYANGENWIFRLSVDDTKAGEAISRYAIENRGFKLPHLLLEETGWGKSNLTNMTAALKGLGVETPSVTWFNWGVKEVGAKILLREAINSGADVIFLVANAPEGKVIAKAMLSFPEDQRLPIISHWGITGGDFPNVIDASRRAGLDLEFIQTRFSFLTIQENSFAQKVLAQAKALFPDDIQTGEDIEAPTGFIHAYDLTRLLIAAIEQTGLTGDILTDRSNIRNALENLEQPVQGLIKTYTKPFSAFDGTDPDAHEALGLEDLTFGKYGMEGEIILQQ
ncbi:MAG: ABC transporter substrate-binding protein [Desulfobulbaceae bacterium]|nr:ABC transporter substrate-binding protein [Desulfobulbaceae bacterium]